MPARTRHYLQLSGHHSWTHGKWPFGKEAEDLIVRSVKVFQEARNEWWEKEGKAADRAYPMCLAGIGPYGAYLADGSEYKGHYGIPDAALHDFHQRRAELLWEAGADVLLFETQPSLGEAKIEAAIAERLGADYWISFSCKDGLHINEGDLIQVDTRDGSYLNRVKE